MIWYSLIFLATLAYTDAYRVVCYYTNWSQYRHGKGTFVPEDVDANLCTHLIYAFAKPVGLDIQAFEWNDDSTDWSKGMYERTMDLKKKNPNLKVLLALGGYNMGSQPFIPIVDTASSRATFAQAAISFLRQRNFDGLDMDWEYPGSRGSAPADKGKLVLLMQELMRAFTAEGRSSGKPRLLLTGALPAGKSTIDSGYDVPGLAASMDFINLMTYDYHGGWEDVTGMNSPLYAHTNDVGAAAQLNLDWTAKYYVQLGAPKDKLNIGIATYGRSFTLDNPSQYNVGAPASNPGNAGQFTAEKGFISYYEVCDLLQAGSQSYDVPSQRNRYLVNANQWVGYDDVQSVKEKACYTKENNFGGVMFWALDLDDFSGTTCGQGTYPLINAVIQEMNSPSTTNCVRSSGGTVPVVGPTPPPYVPPITQAPPPTAQPGQVSQSCHPANPATASREQPVCFYFTCAGRDSSAAFVHLIYATAHFTANADPASILPTSNFCTYANRSPSAANSTSADPTSNLSNVRACANRSPSAASSTSADPATNLPTFAPVQTAAPQQPGTQGQIYPLPTFAPIQTGAPTAQPVFTFRPLQTFAPAQTASPYNPVQPGGTTPAMSQTSTFDCSNKLNDFYADPVTCEYFYICADRVTYKVHCATGLLFNENLKHCDFAMNVNCNKPSSGGQVTSAPITAAPVTSAPINNNINGNYNVCGRAQTGLVAHPYNCHKFIQCVGGTAYEMDCQTGMVFNALIGVCDFAANTVCNTP